MAIYVYTPGNPRALQSEVIALEGRGGSPTEARKDVYRERHVLLNMGMNAVNRGTVRSKEIPMQLAKADTGRLPVELMSRILDPDHYDPPVVNMDPRAFGVAMRLRGGVGAPYFTVQAEKVERPGTLLEEGALEPEAFESLVIASALAESAIYRAVQYQPFVEADGLHVSPHASFGYMRQGQYRSVVTALSAEYPLSQAVMERRQAAGQAASAGDLPAPAMEQAQ
ncbi:MAG: hypothetical protein ACREJM_04675 [Candidatus Saccharimonadales bacterium]